MTSKCNKCQNLNWYIWRNENADTCKTIRKCLYGLELDKKDCKQFKQYKGEL